MAIELRVALLGTANGAPVRGEGEATVDLEAGSVDVALRVPDIPHRWDLVLALSGIVNALSWIHAADDDPLPVLVGTRYVLLDDDGRELGEGKLSVVVDLVAGTVEVQVEARASLELQERVTAVDAVRVGAVPGADRGVSVATSVWTLESSRGHRYVAIATAWGETERCGVWGQPARFDPIRDGGSVRVRAVASR